METLDDLKREIRLLDDLRIDLQHTQRFPDIGGKIDIILSDMQRVNSRIAELLNPNEGGMLVSEMVETPQKWDICLFTNDDVWESALRPFLKINENGLYVDGLTMGEWKNCKVIKKANGTSTSNP